MQTQAETPAHSPLTHNADYLGMCANCRRPRLLTIDWSKADLPGYCVECRREGRPPASNQGAKP